MSRRLIGLLLFTVFLGAGTTLPGSDVLVHHWGVGENQRAHIEPAGGCSSHAGHCTLGRTATGAGASIADAPVLRMEPLAGTALRLVPPTVVAGADHITLPQSRAPPAPVG